MATTNCSPEVRWLGSPVECPTVDYDDFTDYTDFSVATVTLRGKDDSRSASIMWYPENATILIYNVETKRYLVTRDYCAGIDAVRIGLPNMLTEDTHPDGYAKSTVQFMQDRLGLKDVKISDVVGVDACGIIGPSNCLADCTTHLLRVVIDCDEQAVEHFQDCDMLFAWVELHQLRIWLNNGSIIDAADTNLVRQVIVDDLVDELSMYE